MRLAYILSMSVLLGSTPVADNPQLALRSSASSTAVAPGDRVSLALDVDLRKGMHIYAPGTNGYIVVDWQVPQTKAVTAAGARYPPAKIIRLPAINESVPAYEDKLRITREIVVGAEKDLTEAAGSERMLTVEGTFVYQACDDKKCYVPKSIPLKWNFSVR